jgi:hypothetical protein
MSKRYTERDESGDGEAFAGTYRQALGMTEDFDDLSDILGPVVKRAGEFARGDAVVVAGRLATFRALGVEEFSRGKGKVRFEDGTFALVPLAEIAHA